MKKNPTFIIEVKSTQHESWQGTIDWVDQNKKDTFRSALELMRMIDSVIQKEKEMK